MPPARRPLVSQDPRTAVLLQLLEKPIDDVGNIPILLHEVATVVVVLSNDLAGLYRAVRGHNGDTGILGRLEIIERDLRQFIDESRNARAQREQREQEQLEQVKKEAEQARKDAEKSKPDSFQRLLTWFAERVLPGLVQTLIILIIGGAAALWFDYRIRQAMLP